MGVCKYCKKPAGLFSYRHKTCHERFKVGFSKLQKLMETSTNIDNSPESVMYQIDRIQTDHCVPDVDLKKALNKGFDQAIEYALDDGVLTEKEEQMISTIIDNYSLEDKDLNASGSLVRVTKCAILRDIMDGIIPERVYIANGVLPFNLQKGERLVWTETNVDFYKKKTSFEYKGGSEGFSIRIAKGIYYRAGRFKGKKVEKVKTVYLDNGLLSITSKHLFYKGKDEMFRIPLNKIIGIEPYSDGIGIQKDGANANPMIFQGLDGWFIYNLVTNITRL